MIELLLLVHLILALFVLGARNLLTAVVLLAVFSLFSAVLFFVLHAPDVALTEAAVGAGISTFFYIWILKRTGKERG